MVDFFVKLFSRGNPSNDKIRTLYGYVCGIMGIFFNIVLFCAKLFIGTISGSISITADAFNNLTDAGSGVITFLAFFFASKRADKDHPFGHGRIEYICGILVSAIIIIVGGELFLSSFQRILDPVELEFSLALAIVLVISVAVKFYMYLYNNVAGKKIDSGALKAVASDSLGDCIATTAVLVGALFTYFTSINIDAYVGAVVSLLIIKTGITSVLETLSPLLGEKPDPELVEKIKNIVMASDKAFGIHDLVVHDYGPGKRFVSLHMEVDGKDDIYILHDDVDRVEKNIFETLGCETVIHMDPIDIGNPIIKNLSELLLNKANEIDPSINVHDLRIVPGPSHTNVIFDVALSPDLFTKADEIVNSLSRAVEGYGENYFAVINPEISYTDK